MNKERTEGPSDQIMCSAINRKLSLNLEAASSQILQVIELIL